MQAARDYTQRAWCFIAVLMATSDVVFAVADSPGESRTPLPPWQRLLPGAEGKKAVELDKRVEVLQEAGKFEEALKLAQELEQLRRRGQGTDHWETISARWQVEAVRRALGAPEALRRDYREAASWQRQGQALFFKGQYRQAEPLLDKVLQVRRRVLGEDQPLTAVSYAWVASNWHEEGRFPAAEEANRKALAILCKTLGEDHPDTAQGYNNLALNLNAQGRYAAAEERYRKALSIRRRVLGEENSDTAESYNNVGVCLQDQGRYPEADEVYRRALDIYRKVLGDDHPLTATTYNNAAINLQNRGRYREAEEGLRKALVIRRQVLGEDHPLTATSYNNLAVNLQDQGRYKEAEEGFRRVLAIRRKVLGEEHPGTAAIYNNLASNFDAQGRSQDAEALIGKALALRRKVLGEEHPDTAASYNNLAKILEEQGRHQQAEEVVRKALAIRRKRLGEEHPDTAVSHNSLAHILMVQGRYQEAEEGYRKALDIQRRVLGEEHLDTSAGYSNYASILYALGRYPEAEAQWLRAAASFATARMRLGTSGLDRATKTSERSPLPALAALLARNGKATAAWQRYEEALGRGTWDDLSARLRRPLSEQIRQDQLIATLDRLDQRIQKSLAVQDPTPAQQRLYQELLTRQRRTQEELNTFARSLEQKYGPAAGQIFELPRIQASLPADAALLGWIDLKPVRPGAAGSQGEHWAFLLRHSGPPACIRLRGSGTGGAWTEDDSALPARLRGTLLSPRGDWRPLARRLREQRLGPLAKQLAAQEGLPALRQLIVLPSPALAGVPIESISEGYTISYALSGTLYTHLHQQPAPSTTGLFALADPVFEAPTLAHQESPRPPVGVLLTVVVPGGNAAQSGLWPNDVLLRYAGQELQQPADLNKLLRAKGAGQSLAVTAWRNGKTFETQVQPGKLGIVLADKPAPEALAELRRLDRRLASRGEKWTALPGTRAEALALARLFGDHPASKLLLGSEASEQQLYELARSGELGRYRYVHLATHGTVDDAWPLRSAVILSQDHLPDPLQQLQAGRPVFDGQLTAREVLEQWHLNAELVTLSACQSALGKYERGEGYVGFAQALLLAGSRSVCLSLWKVDDTATALLMQRFYANLLGKRPGLQAPLSKALALREAKTWLRGLSRAEALRLAADLHRGLPRGKGARQLPLLEVPPPAVSESDEHPYAHPYYWAAFILLGDPG